MIYEVKVQKILNGTLTVEAETIEDAWDIAAERAEKAQYHYGEEEYKVDSLKEKEPETLKISVAEQSGVKEKLM